MRLPVYRKLHVLALLFLVMIAASSCRVTKSVADPKDISYIYNPLNNPFNPRYRVFNESSTTSLLFIRLSTSELFFSEANPTGEPLASLRFTVRLYNDTEGGALKDTARYETTINRNRADSEIITTIPLTAHDGAEYTAEVRIMDIITNRMTQTFVRFDKTTPYSSNNFRVSQHELDGELFSNVLAKDEYVNLRYPAAKVDTLFVFYYRYFDQIPFAPSVMIPERTVPREPEMKIPIPWTDTLPIMFPGKGIYLCSIDSNIYQGFTFFNFGDDYPNMTSPDAMIEPLAYLATQDEMNDLRNSLKPKVALDEFWLKRSSNIERSRELLRIYYNRVVFANYYFTSYKEGWRTDRGMIYLIYGPPDKVYKGTEGERWGYRKIEVKSTWGTRSRITEDYLWFNFRNNRNPFTTNDFYLNRSDATPTFWEQAILSWRNGIVFRLDNPDDI